MVRLLRDQCGSFYFANSPLRAFGGEHRSQLATSPTDSGMETDVRFAIHELHSMSTTEVTNAVCELSLLARKGSCTGKDFATCFEAYVADSWGWASGAADKMDFMDDFVDSLTPDSQITFPSWSLGEHTGQILSKDVVCFQL